MLNKAFKVTNIAVFILWSLILSFLLYQTYWGTPFENTSLLGQHLEKRTIWYAVFTDDKKLGFAKSTFQEVGNEIVIGKELTINMRDHGTNKDTERVENLKCLCNNDYTVKSFQYSASTLEGIKTSIEGRIEDNFVLFFIEQKGKNYVRKIPTGGRAIYLPLSLIPVIHRQKPAQQTAYRVTILDPVNTRLVDTRVVLDEIIPLTVGVDIKSVFKYNVAGNFFWTDETGTVIKEKHPPNIRLYAVPESIAIERTERPVFDYTSLPFLKANEIIQYPAEITALKIKIKGVPFNVIQSDNSVTPVNSETFVIHGVDPEVLKKTSYTLPNIEKGMKQYLAADNWVSSDYGPLADTGRIYAKANDYDAFALTSYLTSYVHNLIATNPQFVLRDSASILDYREGDHIEKTLMFATYARAAGLPTRLMGGLVYRNGYFFFHTWPEVRLGKWVPVDPTLYQFPADATHIPLITGSLTDIIALIDNLKSMKLEIVEVL